MDYKKSVIIKSDRKKIFEALTNGLPEWWGAMDNSVKGAGDVFKVSWNEPFYQFKILEYVPDDKLTWECTDANQLIAGLQGVQKEWVGTKLFWSIEQNTENSVKVTLHHRGLVPELICYDVCSTAWNGFIGESLKNYLERS